jgi:hypothetical protein
MARQAARRGLFIAADGAQTAFAAGAAAELARRGASWTVARGAGLGAQAALLAVLGEAEEAERRWRREAASGCSLLTSAVAAARRLLSGAAGIAVVPDAWSLAGWLDPLELRERLAPEMAAPARLRAAGARCAVAVEDLAVGQGLWVELADSSPDDAVAALVAAASFPAGWPAVRVGEPASEGLRWGGVGLVADYGWLTAAPGWDVICGFPVPPAPRPALGGSLLELVQRRDEVHAGLAIGRCAGSRVRVVAPTADAYVRWAARDGADLGSEYPLPWERNGELLGTLLEFGRFRAREELLAGTTAAPDSA